MIESASSTRPWHVRPVEDVTAERPYPGLTRDEARKRAIEAGPNQLKAVGRPGWPAILFRQFRDPLIAILTIAATVSASIGEPIDALVILAIVVLNGLLGFVQEWRAERALDELREMLVPTCKVVRDGVVTEIDSRQVVPGDLVRLDTGDRIPADLRMVESIGLFVDQSALTGESTPTAKRTEADPLEAPLAERASMAYAGTTVTAGHGGGVVVGTGMQTEFGRVARLTESIEREPTPLQRRLARLGAQLGIGSIAIAFGVAALGVALGKPLLEMFLAGVSLAVAVVPEGLPAIVTITFALGVRTMARRRALLRRLQAAETLGTASVICTDKTGTLTRNEMTVRHVWTADRSVDVTGTGYAPEGRFEVRGVEITPDEPLRELLETGTSCNTASLSEHRGAWQVLGDPTEAALLVAARKAAIARDTARRSRAEFPFSSERKRMTVVIDGTAHVKGAPEAILERCTR
ncbi:MAG: HAD-IC family P-type ATPase, partial [Planctomycetes bacterium]|nr:HAD-IC family P-type ATPase [Planctomycetota bacterium]